MQIFKCDSCVEDGPCVLIVSGTGFEEPVIYCPGNGDNADWILVEEAEQ